MTAIAFALAAVYLAWFYFYIDYGVEKESLLLPLFARGAASVIISIVFLTSIVQSGLPFMVFPQALTLNGFAGAVMGATVGPAVIGELLQHIMARNSALLESAVTSTCRLTSFSAQLDSQAFPQCIGQLQGMVQLQSLVESMKEIYGLLLMIALVSLLLILVGYSHIRRLPYSRNGKQSVAPFAILSAQVPNDRGNSTGDVLVALYRCGAFCSVITSCDNSN